MNKDLDVTNSDLLDDEYSNFRLFGIGKATPKQKRNKEFRQQLKKEIKTGGIKGVGKALLTLSQRYNPAAAIPRAGVIAGFRVNIFGLATRLYPAFLTEDELKSKKMNVDNSSKAKAAWEKVSKFWRGLGGNPESLKEIIKNAHNKPIFKTKKSKARKEKENGFDGSEYEYSNYDGGASAVIVAGIGLLGAIVGMVGKAGAKKNPYDDKEIDTDGMDVDQSQMASPEEIKAMENAAAKDLAEGKGLDDGGSDDKILGMSKPLFWTGVAVLGLGVVAIVLWKTGAFKKAAAAVPAA